MSEQSWTACVHERILPWECMYMSVISVKNKLCVSDHNAKPKGSQLRRVVTIHFNFIFECICKYSHFPFNSSESDTTERLNWTECATQNSHVFGLQRYKDYKAENHDFEGLSLELKPTSKVRARMHAKSLQSCLTLCNPVDCSPPGFSVHGILQARILEWVAVPSSRGASWPKDQTWLNPKWKKLATRDHML